VSRGFRSGRALETDYPFRETLKITDQAGQAGPLPPRPARAGWAEGASVRIAGGKEEALKPGTFQRFEPANWRGAVEVALRFPMRPQASTRYNEAVSVERGPLVYALKIGETWNRVNADKPHRELPHGDFEVRPATPWNYGLLLDMKNAEAGLRFEEQPVGDRPFSPEGAGMTAAVKGRKIKTWKMAHGWPPNSPPGRPHPRSRSKT